MYTVVFKPSGWQLSRTCICLVQAFHSRAIQAIPYSHSRDSGHQRVNIVGGGVLRIIFQGVILVSAFHYNADEKQSEKEET